MIFFTCNSIPGHETRRGTVFETVELLPPRNKSTIFALEETMRNISANANFIWQNLNEAVLSQSNLKFFQI